MTQSAPPDPVQAAQVAPFLWIGPQPPTGTSLKAAGCDAVVLCATSFQLRDEAFPGVEVLRYPFEDYPHPDPSTWDLVQAAAREVATRIALQKHVLVTCIEGRNRSGLVCALVCYESLGAPSPDAAIARVRQARGEIALSNAAFVEWLRGRERRSVSS